MNEREYKLTQYQIDEAGKWFEKYSESNSAHRVQRFIIRNLLKGFGFEWNDKTKRFEMGDGE